MNGRFEISSTEYHAKNIEENKKQIKQITKQSEKDFSKIAVCSIFACLLSKNKTSDKINDELKRLSSEHLGNVCVTKYVLDKNKIKAKEIIKSLSEVYFVNKLPYLVFTVDGERFETLAYGFTVKQIEQTLIRALKPRIRKIKLITN